MAKATEEKEQELIPFTKSSLPILEFNFDDMKKELNAEMATYKGVVVTIETLKEDKKLAQELKAKGAAFNKQRLDKVKAISEPIVEFTNQMNELKDICIKSSELISKQVEVFEKETLVTIEKLLRDTLNEYRDTAKVTEEFSIVGSEKCLVKLGAVTAKGALTKGSKEKLTAIVADELAFQNKIDYRLLQLESEGHKANLDTPLKRINVEAFLFQDDERYAESLKLVIESELERQAERKQSESAKETISSDSSGEALTEIEGDANKQTGVKERLGKLFDNDPNQQMRGDEPSSNFSDSSVDTSYAHSAENQEVTEDEYNVYAEQMMQEQSQHQPEPAIQLKDGHVMCIATATFKVSVPHQVSEEMVREKLIKMLNDAGVSTLDTMQVRKVC